MPKVLCTLPNASDEISGVKFVTHAKGMLSEEVSDDVAAGFAAIPGYELIGSAPTGPTAEEKAAEAEAEAAAKKATEEAEAVAAAAKEAAKADLLARAAKVELKVKANWSLERLTAEVEAAEKAAADVKPTDESKPQEDTTA